MNKVLVIAVQEYRRNVFKRSFLLVILSVPALIAASVGFGWLIDSSENKSEPVGVVDRAGVIPGDAEASRLASQLISQGNLLDFIAYETETDARVELEAQSIQAYVILPENYREERQVELVFIDEPGSNVTSDLETYLKAQLLSTQDSRTAGRVVSGTDITVRSMDGLREIPGSGLPLGLIISMFLCLAFLFLIMMSSGYMLDAISEEKENRTLELLTTTVTSQQLLAGKVLGVIGIGFTILFTWVLFLVIGILIGSSLGVSWLGDISFDWRIFLATVAIAIPAFVLVAAIMTGIGAMVTTTSEGQSVSAVFFILHLLPLYIAWSFATTPNGPLAVVLSLAPFTALLTLGMRHLFTIVPAWQIYTSMLIQGVLAVGAVWLAGRAFRLGRLQYGQRLSLRKILRSSG